MSLEERKKLSPLFPDSLPKFISQLNRPELAGTELSLLLSLFYRETNFKIFLDEDTSATAVTGPGGRPGAGLAQITAWIEEYKAKWGPHGYEQYATERLKEVLKGFSPSTSMDTVDFMSRWLPLSIDLDSRKQVLSQSDRFIRSPYNPAVAFWYGKISVKDAEEKLAKLGLKNLSGTDRAAIFGAFYNAGESRLRCAVERMKDWNDFFSSLDIRFKDESYLLHVERWDSMRLMLYLHSENLRKAGMPEALISRLERVCENKENCSCLDQEKKVNSSVLNGLDFKAAVTTSYGDHMRKLITCFDGFVQENMSFDLEVLNGCPSQAYQKRYGSKLE